jgi:uroporphyrinogen-III decarboxylase
MTKPLLAALELEPLDRPPVWVMRQAGRYLPEYRRVRERHEFQEVVSTPELAAELTLQPVRRFGMDGAIVFADIMTPLEAMGVAITFDPGPRLEPLTLRQVVELPPLDVDAVGHLTETIRLVGKAVPADTTVIGFAGAPITLLAYLLEGGGSKGFMAMRAALRSDPVLADEALANLAASTWRAACASPCLPPGPASPVSRCPRSTSPPAPGTRWHGRVMSVPAHTGSTGGPPSKTPSTSSEAGPSKATSTRRFFSATRTR